MVEEERKSIALELHDELNATLSAANPLLALYRRMARAVLRRGLHGDPHSVWSLRAPTAAAGEARRAA